MKSQHQDPIYSQISQVKDAVSEVLEHAKKLGATAAEAAMSSTSGLSVSTRMGEVETIEFNQDGGLGISVYVGNNKGSASTADLNPKTLRAVVEKAIDIAKFTSDDPCNGIADKELLEFAPKDLDLFHPWDVSPEQGIDLCHAAEQAALNADERIVNSDGASFSSHQGLRVYGNSHGLIAGFPRTRHSISTMVIGKEGEHMQRDSAYTISRDQAGLKDAASVGLEAAAETLAKLNSQKLGTMKVPVIFRADIANSLFGHLVSAIGGGALYRKSSFLLDSLGTQVFSKTVNISERPHLLKGLASSPFDSEGVKTLDREIIHGGELQTYLLASYAARKMNMTPTGHAGGIHNWLVEQTHQDLTALLKTMGTGLLVTELMGQGVNTVTGDYSRGAAGFWVENGEIQYPVSEITIAGNLKDMFKGIFAIGGDIERRGGIQTGSVLIEQMQVAGA
ncbi:MULTISPECIES: metalloprotease PmbA [Pseudoalteromonas]|uniref:Metalloprotease PmbA n=1 Tax=Pseudoalteromonas tetraodonis TaxID=43659 RepID=A0ABD4EMI3_9GAMM|nr:MULTISPECIES: metalloprotease PmbA [Pseudoalteromonas]MAY59001.1 metalloprotease PmbA [Pseudoalteromonas sp.]KYL35298.1 metalloprotease PmbA [Pseudoalteromonas spiralis]MDN3395088.1 metalloprotease PmbA [Pseudoalteromonas sp. APC 3215]MDN3401035.1 metalloprotease PmbA [Pseudoalteromonas sp. APC 3213]MDN3405050.1 metalloprotease PmbA [Pseudoalteromonas sp. APC 3218]|tara:strand:- start:3055 stop:4404 length:1350 start_codon:yes stop_codon:yes gene_type:complete